MLGTCTLDTFPRLYIECHVHSQRKRKKKCGATKTCHFRYICAVDAAHHTAAQIRGPGRGVGAASARLDICGKLWASTPYPNFLTFLSQTEHQNPQTRAGELLLLLQVGNEERVNEKPSWRREKMMNHNQKAQHQNRDL